MTALQASATSIIYGQPVAFTANVTASSIPNGNVTFKDGTSSLGTATLDNSGLITFSTSAIPAGSHSITAVYNGNAIFLSSTSPAIALNVAQAAATANMTCSLNPSTYGQAITFGVSVRALSPATSIPTGNVTFKDGTSSLGTATLDNSGLATFSTSTISVGSHTINSVYSGDNNFIGVSANLTTRLIVIQHL